jgi:hypothetical protein
MVDATTQAALEAQTLYWRALLYADFSGDVLRGTTGLYDKTVSSSDTELNGTYESFSNNIIEVGAVKHNESGSDTVAVSMSGLIVNNVSFLTLIGDKSKWQGRAARLWFYCADANETQVGSIIPYYTGYMNDITISGDPKSQTVTLTIENYLVSLAGAPNKTLLQQSIYDSGDLSAAASIAAANGMVGAGFSGATGTGDWRDSWQTKLPEQ